MTMTTTNTSDDSSPAHDGERPAPPVATMRIKNPLPHEYATTEPGVGGQIKVRPEDFLVDELPLYEPEGEGEHVYVCVQKRNVSHVEMISVLRRHFGVDHTAIGFAGMKDKMGITRQVVSVHLPGHEPPAHAVEHDRIQILGTARHGNKLRLGHIRGNRFSIRVRDVDPMRAPTALRVLRQLETNGAPNYFGAQRFGYRGNNHVLGALVLRGEWRKACDFLLGTSAGGFPEYQRPKREMYDAGKHAEAVAHWTTADRTEHIVTKKLARGYRPRDALLGVGETAVEFWISALQSAIFNRVLDVRIRAGGLYEIREGDIACKHENRAMFHVTAADLADGSIVARAAAQEIAATAPLWGRDIMRPPPGGEVDAIEVAALRAMGFEAEEFLALKRCPPGQRRPLTAPIRHAQLEAGTDDYGEYIRLAFDLPRGSYATVVLREIMKNDQSHDVPDDAA
jgi:tRNA pseudouridine13 synthase